MMLDINLDKLREGFWRFAPVGAFVGLVIAAEMIVLIWMNFHRENYPLPAEFAAGYSNTKALGLVLYTDYVYPFELAAVLLLVAIIAAITLTMRHRKDTKYQNPALQVKVRREDRLRMISMPSEKSE
jgi:NADH-quinone oxidoreductase subunit J